MEIARQSLTDLDNCKVSQLEGGTGFRAPLVLEPVADTDLRNFFAQNKDLVNEEVHQLGASLYRGWNVNTADDFFEVMSKLSDKSLDYTQRTSPRSQVIKKVYTSTDYPADQEIKPHNESSYASAWPLLIGFYCFIQPGEGGETPISDNREILKGISDSTLRLFEEKGIRYTRNMLDWLGLSWQEVYQTEDQAEVEALLTNDGMQFEWVNEDHLRVQWHRPAFQTHPVLGEKLWFNHAYFYHRLNQDPRLMSLVDPEDMPFSVSFGDGTEIGEDIFEELQAAYKAATITFPWQKGDVLVMDNMLFSHARNPFKGERKILVSMADPVKFEQPA